MKKQLRKFQTNISANEFQFYLQDKKVMLPLRNSKLADYSRYRHTLDVKLVAKMIVQDLKKRNISLQEDIIDLMCDWHDIGHCPFGHAGEVQLNTLLSENDMWYLDSFFSGYKHNLLSAKILLSTHINIPWSVVDGVIKHTSVLPQNFNVTRVQNDNILKLNYIFRPRYNIKHYEKSSWEQFISQNFANFPCCHCRTKNKKINECKDSHIELCRKKYLTYCCSDCTSDDSCGENITRYLLYPYNLTLEGEILHFADEIAALTNDIFYYFKYVTEYHNDKSKSHVVKQQILNAINQLKAIYPHYAKLYKGLTKIIDGEVVNTKDAVFIAIQEFFTSRIKINNYIAFNSPIDGIQAYVSVDSNGICQPLMHFSSDAQRIFDNLKKSIYNLIHKDRLILEDNKIGVESLKKTFFYFYDHVDKFFEETENSQEIQYQLNEITDNIRKSNIPLIEKIKMAKSTEMVDGNKLLNAYRREVVFYIASKPEKWVLDFAQVL